MITLHTNGVYYTAYGKDANKINEATGWTITMSDGKKCLSFPCKQLKALLQALMPNCAVAITNGKDTATLSTTAPTRGAD